jgi:hypothetical protein
MSYVSFPLVWGFFGSGGGGGGGGVESVTGNLVDNTDALNPIVDAAVSADADNALSLGTDGLPFYLNPVAPSSIDRVGYGSTVDYSAGLTGVTHVLFRDTVASSSTVLLPTGTLAPVGTLFRVTDNGCLAGQGAPIDIDAGTSNSITANVAGGAQIYQINTDGASVLLQKVSGSEWKVI